MEPTERERLIHQHLEEIRRLQVMASPGGDGQWPPHGFYWLFHVVVGIVLGMMGAAMSLVVNVVGASLVGRHPLDLIRVYLTFPMGEPALHAEGGKVLFVGCCLYLITGGLFGIMFHTSMRWYFSAAPLRKRFLIATIMGLGLWIVNFYLILSWLQPVLLGGNWIITELPFYVAAGTHLVFAWTMLLVEFWGEFEPFGAAAMPAAVAKT